MFDNGRGMTVKGTRRRGEEWERGLLCFLSGIRLVTISCLHGTHETRFVYKATAGKWLGNGWVWQRVFSVGQLPPFCLFLFCPTDSSSPCPCPFPYVASSTLVCLLICLTCVSMMTQHKNSTKSEQNLKDKANSSNSNNIKQQQQQPKQQQHSEKHI